MAVAAPNTFNGTTLKKWAGEATADGDTQIVIPHGFSSTPLKVTLVPVVAAARISSWILLSVDATNITIGKTTTAGSGAAGAQVEVIAELPHSLVR